MFAKWWGPLGVTLGPSLVLAPGLAALEYTLGAAPWRVVRKSGDGRDDADLRLGIWVVPSWIRIPVWVGAQREWGPIVGGWVPWWMGVPWKRLGRAPSEASVAVEAMWGWVRCMHVRRVGYRGVRPAASPHHRDAGRIVRSDRWERGDKAAHHHCCNRENQQRRVYGVERGGVERREAQRKPKQHAATRGGDHEKASSHAS